MDTQSSTTESVKESEEKTPSHFVWSEIRDNPTARLNLLKEVRNVAGGKEMLSALYDHVRAIGASTPAERESLKEGLADMLSALGMSLEGAGDVQVQASEKKEDHPVDVSLSPVAATTPTDQGFAHSRPTPEFSAPQVSKAPAPAPEVSAFSTSVPEASTASAPKVGVRMEHKELSLEEIKKDIARVKEEIGVSRFMEALKGGTPEDQEYVQAQNALNALGNPDTAPITDLRQAHSRLTHAAEQLSKSHNEVPQEVQGVELPTVAESSTANQTLNQPMDNVPAPQSVEPEVMPVSSTPPVGAVAPLVGVPSWSNVEPANADVPNPLPPATAVPTESFEPPPPSMPPPAPQEVVAQASPVIDPYREPITETGPYTPQPMAPQPSIEPSVAPEPPVQNTEVPVMEQVPMEETAPANDVEVPAETVPSEAPAETVPEEARVAMPQEENSVLMAPEVTKGLEELVSQWAPFATGGWFGMGAHGIEHPLYIKLKTLPVSEVLAGTWESTDSKKQPITNSIREYQNGWKEQYGIDTDPTETFETYLRRVIAGILSANQVSAPEQVAA